METALLNSIWGLLTLTLLELVLNIDNVIFLSIVAERLPADQQPRARKIGLILAAGLRSVMLLGIGWLIGLTAPVFTLFSEAFSWRDLILIGGGLFLIAKATSEIHNEVEGEHEAHKKSVGTAGFAAVIFQILLLDLVFSVDSIFTAVGMVEEIWVMIVAMVVAIGLMILAAEPIATFVKRHPTVKMLALGFLLMIGLALISDGLGVAVPKGYLYAAVGFAVLIEGLNMLRRRNASRAMEKSG